MWELMLADIAVDRCMLEFSVNYSVYDEISSYRYKFDITNFMVIHPLIISKECKFTIYYFSV